MSTKVTELGIVKKIMAKLQLGDAGKIGSFFAKQVKSCDRSIRDLRRNLETLKNQQSDDKLDLNDKLDDAKEALVDAYENVSPDDVKTNAKMGDFETTYWKRVTSALDLVKDIEDKQKSYKEKYNDNVKDINEQIEKYQARIDALKKVD